MTGLRVGLGFDVHACSDDPDRRLILGGVEVDGRGLIGHSDADVVAHAVADALLGASGLADIGTLFPASDPAFAGIDSMDLLARAVLMVTATVEIGNVDVKVVLDAPKLAPHRQAMADRLTAVVGAPVTVTAKRAEGLGAIGRGEGVACWAVALVTPR